MKHRRLVAVLGYSPRGGGSLHPICAARLARAAVLAKDGDVVLLSGWSRRPDGETEAELMARAWHGPAVELVRDRSARHTVENAAEVAALARTLSAREVLVVTSWWHRPRAEALVRAALRGSGARVQAAAAPSPASLVLLAAELGCLAALPVQLLAVRRRRRHGVGRPRPSGSRLSSTAGMEVEVRRARTSDVAAIRSLVESYAQAGILLGKPLVSLYEDVQEFWVAARPVDGAVIGCGALHVMWEDLAEVRSVAVDPAWRGRGIGSRIVERLLETARSLGVRRVFVLTFEVDFFAHHGFEVIDGAPIAHEVYEELLRSFDEGVAEFLDLERVKPNTLGNTRMLLSL